MKAIAQYLAMKPDRTRNKNDEGDCQNRTRLDKDNKDNSKRGGNKNSDLDLDKPVEREFFSKAIEKYLAIHQGYIDC